MALSWEVMARAIRIAWEVNKGADFSHLSNREGKVAMSGFVAGGHGACYTYSDGM